MLLLVGTAVLPLAASAADPVTVGDPASQGLRSTATMWQRWEVSFEASGHYGNPYQDVELELHLTDPFGRTSTIRGFWDGDSTWRARYAFPMVGRWSYTTQCSRTGDSGLHGRTGTVTVEKYSGTNPVYRHGFLRADGGGGRYMQHWDETPFLYFADTTWFPWAHFSTADWEDFVEDRAARGFTVIQTSLGFEAWWDKWSDGGCSGSPTRSIAPWFGQLGAAEKYNPRFYQIVDQFVQIANDHGLVLSLFGLMNAGEYGMASTSDRQRFARTIAARLQGNATTLSSPVDDPWDVRSLMNEVGEHLRDTDDSRRPTLRTAHMGTSAYNCGDPSRPGHYDCDLHDRAWVSFNSYQSGHNKPQGDQMVLWSVRRAREMPLEYSLRSPRKPVVNVEPLYSMPPNWFPANHDLDDNAYRCRQIAWYTFLSGGTGHAVGIWGIWDFGLYQLDPCGNPRVDWRDAMRGQYSREAEYVVSFLADLDWHMLRPRHDLIRDQTGDERSKKVLAMALDQTLVVAYVPRSNAAIKIDTREMHGGGSYRWYNPRTGTLGPGSLWTNMNQNTRFPTPNANEDWVLLLDFNQVGPPPTTSFEEVEALPVGAARALALHPLSPNPFSVSTSIEFDIIRGGRAQLAVFDVAGRLVRTLVDRDLDGPLRYRLRWDGSDGRGQETGSGIYFIRLIADEQRVVSKVIRMR